MLSFFKLRKKTITSLFPTNFVDIHSHLIPGIDDGSKNLEETVSLLKQMQGFGMHNFITTPHVMGSVWRNSSKFILDKQKELKDHLNHIGMTDITIRVAAEYMLDGNFLKLLEKKDLLVLQDNKILVEMSYINAPINLYDILFKIQVEGYLPILAHPERYFFYHKNFEEYVKLKKAGCLFQLNLLSLTNYYGKDVQRTAIQLLEESLIDFVGTDMHRKQHLDYLEKINDRKILQLITPILENNSTFF
jgi:protein-tyrosine phosphatase